jgi:hypothetical protein
LATSSAWSTPRTWKVGDTLFIDEPVTFPWHPELRPPEHFSVICAARHRPVQAVPSGHRPA